MPNATAVVISENIYLHICLMLTVVNNMQYSKSFCINLFVHHSLSHGNYFSIFLFMASNSTI